MTIKEKLSLDDEAFIKHLLNHQLYISLSIGEKPSLQTVARTINMIAFNNNTHADPAFKIMSKCTDCGGINKFYGAKQS